MAAQQMDAVTSFVYLTDNIPSWITDLEALSVHATQKTEEFVAEYARLVKQVKPKQRRIKSPSVQSVRSKVEELSESSTTHMEDDASIPTTPNKIEINPLEAGNKYLYAQAQRKRKPDGSIRSGASGPQKFRSKNHVVIYYDSYLQERLESMVKAIGVARNNLRKGKIALVTINGFQLPTLKKRYDSSTLPSTLDNIRASAISRSNPTFAGGKLAISTNTREPKNDDEAAFTSTDKCLESVQGLCETAAHQFLRDGDCKSELESSVTKLKVLLEEAKTTTETLKQKAQNQNASSPQDDGLDINPVPTLSDDTSIDFDNTVPPNPLVQTSNVADAKLAPKIKAPAVADLRVRAVLNAPPQAVVATIASLPTAGVEIEVDDASDQSSIEVDISKFRVTNPARLRALR